MVVVGRIQGPYGIKGWVHVASFTDPKENIRSYSPWRLGRQPDTADWRAAEVENIRPHKQGYVAKLRGIDDRNGADAAKGLLIGVPEASLPKPDSGEYYWRDLIGAEVLNADGAILGRVASLIETGAHDVLVIEATDGSADRADNTSDTSDTPEVDDILIPFHPNYVLGVDQTARQIRVDWQTAETE